MLWFLPYSNAVLIMVKPHYIMRALSSIIQWFLPYSNAVLIIMTRHYIMRALSSIIQWFLPYSNAVLIMVKPLYHLNNSKRQRYAPTHSVRCCPFCLAKHSLEQKGICYTSALPFQAIAVYKHYNILCMLLGRIVF